MVGYNRTASTTYTGTYDDQDRLLSYGPFDYIYTANGELETKTNRDTGDAWLFQYDALGNLLTVGLPNGDLVEYLVDGIGRRVGKKKNGVLLKQWIYRDALKPVAELDGSGALVSEFVYGSKSNVPDYVRRGGATYRVISDHLGSPRYVVNVANASDVPFTATYTSFGEVTGTGLAWMPFGFAGGMLDPDTRLTRFGKRDFEPALGRWISKDPLRFVGGRNFFAYASNDPINQTDAAGTLPEALDSVWKAFRRFNKYFSPARRFIDLWDACTPDFSEIEATDQLSRRCAEAGLDSLDCCDLPGGGLGSCGPRNCDPTLQSCVPGREIPGFPLESNDELN